MSDSSIRVPPDSLGKIVRTFAKPVGSATHQTHFYVRDGFAQRFVQLSSATSFYGEGRPGSLDASASWRIRRIIASGTTNNTTWAGGLDTFSQIWNNRYSLTYS